MLIPIKEITTAMGAALARGDGVYFIGSGISAASRLPTWTGLIQELANSLGLTLTDQDDLPLIAQHCVNADNGNRGPLVGRLKRLLGASQFKINSYHDSIKRTNLRTIWTTNYDLLLEQAFQNSRLAIRSNDADITGGNHDFDVELLKIHGCISRSSPREFVITTEDYEEFGHRRPAMSQRLREDLVLRSFLFIGYGYKDPNINTVMAEARRLAEGATREHYLITRGATKVGERRRQELWLDDLRRYGIRSACYDKFSELDSALSQLARLSRGKSVYITGGHVGGPNLAASIGRLLAKEQEIVMLDGQSQGTGRKALNAFGRECLKKRWDMRNRLKYFPNPYAFDPKFSNDSSLIPTLMTWRDGLFRAANVVVVFDGGMGTEAELEVARNNRCRILPVPAQNLNKTSSPPKVIAADLLGLDGIKEFLPKDYVDAVRNNKLVAKDVVECIKCLLQP